MIDKIGIQLKALYNECEADLEGTFDKISKMGYKGVEFCCFFGRSPEEILEILKKYNLELISSHVPLEDMLDEYDSILKYQKELGAERIVITYGEMHGSESLSLLIDNLNSLHCRLRQHKIDLFYHNHEQEFKNFGMSGIALDTIMDKTELLLEIDSFWVESAGHDPIQIMKKYEDRIPLVHLKDGENHIPCAIGYGTSRCKEVYDCSLENKVDWVIVEISSKEENPLDSIEKSIRFIKENY